MMRDPAFGGTSARLATPKARCEMRDARHEVKFVFPSHYADLVSHLLEHRCARDPRFVRNTIHSLYFDTRRLDSLNEKNESEYLKCKIRIRWYSDRSDASPSSAVYLEMKRKEGSRSFKDRTQLSIDPSAFCLDPVASGEALDLSDLLHKQYGTEFRNMVPVCVIHYVRRRFIDMATGCRIAADTNISVSDPNPRLCFPGAPGRLDSSVLEVKGSRVDSIPHTLTDLREFGLRKTSFSKYAECVNTLLRRGG